MARWTPADPRRRARRAVAHVAAIGVLGLLTLGAAESGPVENECVGVEASVSVDGGDPQGLQGKHCLVPTRCNGLAERQQQTTLVELVEVSAGAWVPHPIHPDLLCLIE